MFSFLFQLCLPIISSDDNDRDELCKMISNIKNKSGCQSKSQMYQQIKKSPCTMKTLVISLLWLHCLMQFLIWCSITEGIPGLQSQLPYPIEETEFGNQWLTNYKLLWQSWNLDPGHRILSVIIFLIFKYWNWNIWDFKIVWSLGILHFHCRVWSLIPGEGTKISSATGLKKPTN